ncbi:hypothetical protein ABT404_12675 [Streptomyces hyaluromycini]|uniref:Transposase n=1 Tax=Streptomyces hyaluromycini TaxID=1377993 RepID=A0ABV1WU87_9ACTN
MRAKKAHYIAVIKTNQPTPHRQLATLPWKTIPVQHTASTAAHGRRESRSVKTCATADNLGGINFPHARFALRLHRRRRSAGQRETRTTVHAVTSLDAHQTRPHNPRHPQHPDQSRNLKPPCVGRARPGPVRTLRRTRGPVYGRLFRTRE